MKLEDLDLDFDFNVEPSGKGSKLKALKDMGVHNQEFDSLDDLYTNEYFKDTTDYGRRPYGFSSGLWRYVR